MTTAHNSLFLFSLALALSGSSYGSLASHSEKSRTILKVDMHLSAFGVESEDFPSIDANIDFTHHSSVCYKTYYDPAYRGSTYHLSNGEMSQVLALLQKADFENFKKCYRVAKTDQPSSTITVHTESKTYTIEDYGLQGEYPLQKLYSLVYKL
jgi:hypothetical protein